MFSIIVDMHRAVYRAMASCVLHKAVLLLILILQLSLQVYFSVQFN